MRKANNGLRDPQYYFDVSGIWYVLVNVALVMKPTCPSLAEKRAIRIRTFVLDVSLRGNLGGRYYVHHHNIAPRSCGVQILFH